jgi:hypothetical protein
LVLGDDLHHALFDALEVVGSERLFHLEVVVEAILNRRADGEGGAVEEVEHSLGEDVGRRVSEDIETLVGVECHDSEFATGFDGSIEVTQLPIDPDRHRGFGQTRAYRLRDLKPGDTIRVLYDFSVWITKL